MGLKNYLAPLGTDVTAEYIPVTERKYQQASLGYYLDYLQAANSSNEQRIVWPGRVMPPYYGGSTLIASKEFGTGGSPFTVAKVERINNQWSYSAGAGRPTWGTEYQNYVILGLVSRYSSNFLSPSTVVNGLRIIQSEDYSVIPPLLTRYDSAMLTQTEAADLGSVFNDCPNGVWLFWNSEEQYSLEAGAGILLATNHPTTPKMTLRYCYCNEQNVWRNWSSDSSEEKSMRLMFQKDGLYYYYADIAVTMVPYADPSQSLRTIYIGLPYVYFPIPGASDINDFTATIKSLFLHLF
jgi:hypothetical protein